MTANPLHTSSFLSVPDTGQGAESDKPSHRRQPGSRQDRSPAAESTDL